MKRMVYKYVQAIIFEAASNTTIEFMRWQCSCGAFAYNIAVGHSGYYIAVAAVKQPFYVIHLTFHREDINHY